jgi:hypothetical protein
MLPRGPIVIDNRPPIFARESGAMTKQRPPLSIDAALGRISGQLPGAWGEMAKIVGKSESTVRRWGDHDAAEQIPLPCAIALDIAYQHAGGEDQPLFDTYALLVKVARNRAFADHIALARQACELIRDGAKAEEAMVLASLPSATAKDRTHAVRELEEVARVVTAAIAILANPETAPLEAPT